MSQEKAQLIAPIDSSFSVPGLTVSGVLTATTFDGTITGVADSITQGKNLNVGVITALSFSGNLTGDAGGLIGSPNTVAGVVTANSFVGGITGNITGDVIGNASGIGASIKQGNNLNVGIATAVEWYGDGSGVTGAGSSAYIAQNITASGAETIIDLSYGNLIYFDSGTAESTTVGFASTSAAEQITVIRDTGTVTPAFTTGGVTMDGTDDYLSLAATTDFECTGDFTIECWFNSSNTADNRALFNLGAYGTLGGFEWFIDDGIPILYSTNASNTAERISGGSVTTGRWYHIALVRSGSTVTMYLDGSSVGSYTDSTTFGNGSNNSLLIGAGMNGGSYMDYWNGVISNARFVKGTAVYTANFTPSYVALTNITNTKLLCCQSDSSTTTAAVTPGTITANSSPTAGAQTITSSSSVTPSITWPDRVKWNGGTTPTLVTNTYDKARQIFRFTTVDTGLNYNAWEEIVYNVSQPHTLFTWGKNDYGQQGLNDKTNRSSPTQIPGNNWATVSVNGTTRFAAMAQKFDSTLWIWGDDIEGKLAQNNRIGYSSPVQIGTDTDWSGAFMNGQAAWMAVKTNGELWMCGSNGSAALGQNDTASRSSPVQLPGTTWSTNIDHLAAATNSSFAIKTDGTLWSWGYNNYGNLGQNTAPQYSSPKQVGTDTTWNFVDAASNSVLAVKTNGTLWAWGNGIWGMLGLNQPSPTKLSSPTQVGTDTTWKSGSIGNYNMVATKTNGTLWIWGVNQHGNLGLNEGYPQRSAASSPCQIPGTTWETARNKVEAGGEHTLALKTDGTLWAWGDNENGGLGLNAQGPTTRRSSPTQIPGTWSKVDVGSDHNFALKEYNG